MKKCPDFRPRALGEIAIRCTDIVAMADFYENIIGLERLRGDHNAEIIFFKIADGFAGHTCILALFQRPTGLSESDPEKSAGPQPGIRSSLHHIALSLPYAEQKAVIDWYESLGQPYEIQRFGWIGWQGIFTTDPEGNTVELVAYDASLKDA